LRGGLRPGITELVGESAAGKSQMALQWLIQAQMPPESGGANGASVYLCTEDVPLKRLKQIAQGYSQRYEWAKDFDFLQNIFIESVPELEQFQRAIFEILPRMLSEQEIRLVVIDSLGAVLRTEFEANEMSERAALLFRIGAHLAKLSSQYACPILVVNQVSDAFLPEYMNSSRQPFDSLIGNYTSKNAVRSSGRMCLPTLGVSWAHCINTRLFVTRESRPSLILPMEPVPADDSVDTLPPTKRVRAANSPPKPLVSSICTDLNSTPERVTPAAMGLQTTPDSTHAEVSVISNQNANNDSNSEHGSSSRGSGGVSSGSSDDGAARADGKDCYDQDPVPHVQRSGISTTVVRRQLHVIFSSYLPSTVRAGNEPVTDPCSFIVKQEGVQGLVADEYR